MGVVNGKAYVNITGDVNGIGRARQEDECGQCNG